VVLFFFPEVFEVSIKVFQNNDMTTCKNQKTSCNFPSDAQNKLESEGRFVKQKPFQTSVQPKQLDGLRNKDSA